MLKDVYAHYKQSLDASHHKCESCERPVDDATAREALLRTIDSKMARSAASEGENKRETDAIRRQLASLKKLWPQWNELQGCLSAVEMVDDEIVAARERGSAVEATVRCIFISCRR